MDFAKTLQAATASLPLAQTVATTNPGHIGSASPNLNGGLTGSDLLYATPSQTNLDRNTVDMDRERASFADNSVKYEATLRFISAEREDAALGDQRSIRRCGDEHAVDLQRLGQRRQRAEPAPQRRRLEPGQRRHRGRPRRPGLQGAPGHLPDRS